MKIGIVAGEASGDLLGAKLIAALRGHVGELQVAGVGGPAMLAAGCQSITNMERLSVMGLIEPLFHLPDLIKLRRELYHYFTKNRPDVFIGIDSPDFNLGLELKLRHAGIPVVHYVSPSVWAWRQKRIHKIAKAVDLMLTLFPFEAKFYEKHHVPVCYVGHSLAEQIPLVPDKLAARRALGIDEQATTIALLPGSRRQEIRYIAEIFLQSAKRCFQARPDLRFLTSHISEERYQEFYACYKQHAPDLPLQFFTNRSHDVMEAADVVLVTSGTATLETMLYKKPMIVAYRMSALTYQLARYLVKLPYFSLPNLLAEQSLVPELLQKAAEPENISQHIFAYLDHPEKMQALENIFTELHLALRPNSSNRAASAIMEMLKQRNS